MASRIEVINVTIKCTVTVHDNTSTDDITQRIAANCDYHLKHEDDVCQVIDTELTDADDACH